MAGRAGRARPGLPRDDDRDEHRDRAQRRPGRDDHDPGLPRHPPHRAPQAPLNFSLWQHLPWQAFPIVRRRYRLTVNERIDKNGDVLIPLDDDEVRRRCKLKEAQVESVSVCLLFSFVNPDHEPRVAEIVREEFPEAFLSVSSEVIPQYREYERFSTIGLNAFVGPKVARYVRRFDEALRGMGVSTGIHLMTSASGVATPGGGLARPGQPAHVRPRRRRRGRHLGGSRRATRTSSRSTWAARPRTSAWRRTASCA